MSERTRRVLVIVVAVAVVAAIALPTFLALRSSSEPDVQDYCTTLREERRVLDSLADKAARPGNDVLTPTLGALGRLRADAPTEVRDEWDTVYYAWQALVDAVDDAGIAPEDFRPGKRPPGIDTRDARRLEQVAAKLVSPRVISASSGLEDHARQVCRVDLVV